MVDLGGGQRGITIGGFEGTGASAGKLVATANNATDVGSVKEVNDKITKFYKSDVSFSANLVPAPQGKSDTDFITGLLSTADKYNETPVGYKYFPSGGDNGNCLSLESFLLMQNGVSPAVTAKALDHPGLDVGADKVITPKVKEPPKK